MYIPQYLEFPRLSIFHSNLIRRIILLTFSDPSWRSRIDNKSIQWRYDMFKSEIQDYCHILILSSSDERRRLISWLIRRNLTLFRYFEIQVKVYIRGVVSLPGDLSRDPSITTTTVQSSSIVFPLSLETVSSFLSKSHERVFSWTNNYVFNSCTDSKFFISITFFIFLDFFSLSIRYHHFSFPRTIVANFEIIIQDTYSFFFSSHASRASEHDW